MKISTLLEQTERRKMADKPPTTRKLIGLSGKCGSGKDTAADIIMSFYAENGIKVEKITFAQKVREVVQVLTGIPPEVSQTTSGKNMMIFSESGSEMTCGHLQQIIGNELRELLFPSLWIYLAICNIKEDTVHIITDVRYPNEVEYIQSKGGIVIRLNGDPGKIRELNLTGRDLSAVSETALDNFSPSNFDHVIENNDSLDSLKLKIKKIIVED